MTDQNKDKQNSIRDRAEAFIRKEKLIEKGDRVLVGVSGGADSVCLLLLLNELKKDMDFKLEAVTLDHGIRGAEAREDVRFVKGLCEKNHIGLWIYREDVPSIAGKEKLSLEDAARKVRYRVFYEAAKKTGASCVAVAHHVEDSSETILHNMVRGSGLRGLSGLPAKRTFHELSLIRPLLCLSRTEIEEWLAEKEQSFVTDSTNAEDTYTRNYLRNRILKSLREDINPRACEHIHQAGIRIREAQELVTELALLWLEGQQINLKTPKSEISLSAEALKELRPIVRRQIYYMICEAMMGEKGLFFKDLTAVHMERTDDLLSGENGRSCILPGNIRVKKQYDLLIFYEDKAEAGGITEKGFYEICDGDECLIIESECKGKLRVSFRLFAYQGEKIPRNNYTNWLDYDTIKNGVSLRFRRSGDYFFLPGGGRKTLKSYLIDRKIPAMQRDRILVLASESHILWIEDGRISQPCLVTEKTRRVLEVRVDKEFNYG